MKRELYLIFIFITTILFAGCPSDNLSYPRHKNITVTIFWIGEEGNEENGFIPNLQSAWDDIWTEHYGGIDDPNNRNRYSPANFTPSENPFYFALPYNDFNENGERKSEAYKIVS